jgi:hypothetical protein
MSKLGLEVIRLVRNEPWVLTPVAARRQLLECTGRQSEEGEVQGQTHVNA